jgi:signal transduction histidine kinase
MLLAEKMNMLGGLVAGMAHEMNNPLGAIVQNAQNIERRLSPGLPANRRVAGEIGIDLERVARYLEEAPFRGRRPVFVGDDANDEHAFAVLNEMDGITIKVGKAASLARYRLPDVAAVRAWLAAGLDRR